MSLIPYYLQFVSEICEGKRPLPEGFALHETDDLKKAVELQTQIQTVGIPEFVRRRGADGEFRTLSRAAARTELSMEDFLAWLGNRELLGSTDEQACVRIMDGCLSRLMAEGQTELAAALLSGDETTFKLFRTEAPELVHLPDATYDWYCKYYLDGYYPIRFILRQNGVAFPAAQ